MEEPLELLHADLHNKSSSYLMHAEGNSNHVKHSGRRKRMKAKLWKTCHNYEPRT